MAGEQLDQKYVFSLLSSKTFPFLQNQEVTGRLMKWSMLGRISAQAFNFDQMFHPYKKNDFVFDFLQDPCVMQKLKVLWSGRWTTLGTDITSVDVEAVPCSKVSMDLFDPLYSGGVLRQSGQIVKCYHDIYGDFDELRNVLTTQDSDKYYLFGPAEREEFLFRLFKHMCLGGEICQYEDTVSPYMDTTKVIYKDLVSVQKDCETKEIKIISTILKVSASDSSGLCYPDSQDSEQSFAYLCVDPLKRHVYVLYHSFGTGLLS